MPSVADFLLERMEHAGIKHVFGVPGDYVLNFYKKISDQKNIDLVNCTDEANAGFAANSYARVNGIGAVCVTYNVGGLKIVNSVACAYAERCPVVVISGSPGIKERSDGMLLHHMVRSFECQKDVFQNITCASVVLDDPTTAGFQIDRAFEALAHHKQPIYIELPRDVADKPIVYDVYRQGTPVALKSDEQNFEEAFEEVVNWIKGAKNPVILAGVQLSRFDLGVKLIKFAEKANIPVATTLLSKSVVNERHSLFLGVYAGGTSQPDVQKAVEESDCLLMFGVLLTDMTLTFMPSRFKKRNCVNCAIEGIKIKNHTYTDIQFQEFCEALFKHELPKLECNIKSSVNRDKQTFLPTKNKMTVTRLFEKINSILDENMSVIADVGDCLFGAADLVMHHKSSFIASAFYTSMGNAIPGVLGMLLAQPDKRPIVLVGDGAFQMSCTELSTVVRRGLNPIVVVLNNHGYTTERYLMDGEFNNIADWRYDKITEMIGGGYGCVVETEEQLEEEVTKALGRKELTILNVIVDSLDVSPALKRMTEGLALRV
jgi:indolepyruvate decarboxylase